MLGQHSPKVLASSAKLGFNVAAAAAADSNPTPSSAFPAPPRGFPSSGEREVSPTSLSTARTLDGRRERQAWNGVVLLLCPAGRVVTCRLACPGSTTNAAHDDKQPKNAAVANLTRTIAYNSARNPSIWRRCTTPTCAAVALRRPRNSARTAPPPPGEANFHIFWFSAA